MPSSSARFARPVRTLASSRLNASMPFRKVPSRSFKTSLTIAPSDDRADGLAAHDALDVTRFRHVEDDDGQLVVTAEGERRHVHDVQVLLQALHVGDLLVALGVL